MRLRILSRARQDLIDGFWFYEKQAPGIGDYFLDCLFSDIDSLQDNYAIYPVFFESYQRLLSQRFPFAVYYRVKDETISVYAVLDCRQNPKETQRRFN